MLERIAEKKRESEPQEDLYEQSMKAVNESLRQRAEGKVVIRGENCNFFQSRQAYGKFLLHRKDWPNVGTPGWHIFLNRITVHSGKHNHQGGMAIYVLAGEGYTVVDGVRYEWESGDLVVLPVQPNGCDHQHFNKDPSKPTEWIVFVYYPMYEAAGVGMAQREEHPDWARGKRR